MKEVVYTFKDGLQKGLRTSEQNPVNNEALVECKGIYTSFGVLTTNTDLAQLDTASLSCTYPYPQYFELSNVTLACSPTAIYELVSGTWELKLESLTEGALWSVADFQSYVVLTNGIHVVIRDPQTLVWQQQPIAIIPVGSTLCTVGGQLIVGSPDVSSSHYWMFSRNSILINALHKIIHQDIPVNYPW